MKNTQNYNWKQVQLTDGRPNIEDVTDVFGDIDSKVKEVETKANKTIVLEQDVTKIKTDVSTINSNITGLTTRVTKAETDITQNKGSIASITSETNAIKQNITGLTTRVDDLENATIDVATVEEAIQGERNDIAMTPYTTKQAHYAWGGGGGGGITKINSKTSGSHTATKQENTFIIQELKETDIVELVFKNMTPVENVDFTVNKLTKVITLNFNLEIGETIYYQLYDTKVDMFKSGQVKGFYQATEETSSFTIQNVTKDNTVTLYFEGTILEEGIEYTATSTGDITLMGWSLKVSERIFYVLESVSYDYNDLTNKPVIPTVDVDKAYVDKVNQDTNNSIGDIKNLTTVDKTNIVNAINELKRTGGGGGATLNVFARTGGTWGKFTANVATNLFTISGFNGTVKCVELYYKSIMLFPNQQYSISNTGEVTLGFQLQVGETIDYCISDVSFDYNELANKPNLALKSDKTYVDTQDTNLQNQITVLQTDKADKVKLIDVDDLNKLTMSGEWVTNNNAHAQSILNKPDSVSVSFHVRTYSPVYVEGGYIIQMLTDYSGNIFIRTYRFTLTNNPWSSWKQLAGTETVNVLWNGSQQTGDIVLTGTFTKYNALCVHTGTGTTYMRSTLDVYKGTFTTAYPLVFLTVGGSAVLTPKDENTFTITSSNQPIRRVEGIFHGIY